jgi:hypothetical protein
LRGGRAGLAVAGALSIALLSGCPVTDRYFIDTDAVQPGAGEASSSQSGSGGEGGAPPAVVAGTSALGGTVAVAPTCEATTERCNGHDDNCNEVVDEQACNSRANGTLGCAGFVLAMRPEHGYMLCSSNTKDYAAAQKACQQQSMRLAWLETELENSGVSAKIRALTTSEAWIGATDQAVEGEWFWDGPAGKQFWSGNVDGMPVDGNFDAWMVGTPNDDNGGEDCAVLNSMAGDWGDRSCSIAYAYLCEEPEP